MFVGYELMWTSGIWVDRVLFEHIIRLHTTFINFRICVKLSCADNIKTNKITTKGRYTFPRHHSICTGYQARGRRPLHGQQLEPFLPDRIQIGNQHVEWIFYTNKTIFFILSARKSSPKIFHTYAAIDGSEESTTKAKIICPNWNTSWDDIFHFEYPLLQPQLLRQLQSHSLLICLYNSHFNHSSSPNLNN